MSDNRITAINTSDLQGVTNLKALYVQKTHFQNIARTFATNINAYSILHYILN